MSDLEGIMEEEGEGGAGDHRTKLQLKDVLSASKVKNQLRKRHKQKMHRKRLTGFERRFSQLALNNTLVPERKRIDYVLVHNDRELGNDDFRQQERDRLKFTMLLEREGFTVQTSKIGDNVYTKLNCSFKRLCREAERVKFEMPIKDCPHLSAQQETFISQFRDKYFETDNEEDFISTGFLMNKIEKFQGHENPNTFFRPAVRSFLTHHILINLNINEVKLDDEEASGRASADNDQKPLGKKEGDGEQAPQPIRRRGYSFKSQTPMNYQGLPYMLMKKNYFDSFVMHDQSERSSIRGDNFLTGTPATISDLQLDSDDRKDLDNTWTRPFKFQPLWKIRNYYGERIAFYFAWSGMLCSSLWIPTLFGICVFLYGLYQSATTSVSTATNSTSIVDSFKDLFGDFKQSFDNDVTPYFGLVICVWGTVFLEIWKRKNAELAYEWDSEQFEANEPDRPNFTGTKSKKDPVTDEFVWYYPFKRQFIKFIFSFSVLIIMIMLVLISVVAIIMYRVIMDIDFCPHTTASECLMLTTVLSSILNAISILLLSRVYNVLARKLTDWENHRTQTKYDDALIFKLFAFQFVNSYASCFYIAFFRGRFDSVGWLDGDKYKDTCEGSCMTQLSFQVLVLMLMKPVPKFLKDIVLVLIRKTWRKYPNCCACLRNIPCFATTNQVGDVDIENAVAGGKNRERQERHLQFLKHEHLKPTLGDFTLDEYTEKIIQYGFLMLFATSFPLAPLLALLTNMFDLRVDAKRLLWWYRRPIAHVAQDIGMWFQILLFVNFCGVVSNAFLIAFTSSWGAKYSTTEKLIIVIGFEHIVFSLKYIVAYMIPDVPAHVTLSIRREKYQILKKMEEPNKEMDYSHLFPVGEDLHSDDMDGFKSVSSQKSSPPARVPRSSAKPDAFKTERVTYLYNKGKPGAQKADEPVSPKSDDLNHSQGGYVAMAEDEDEKQERLNPSGELWYCGPESDRDSAAAKLKAKHSGKVVDLSTTTTRHPSETDLFSSRHSRVSASDVKPQGANLWESMDEVEAENSDEMRRHSANYPKADDGGRRQRLQSGHSTTKC